MLSKKRAKHRPEDMLLRVIRAAELLVQGKDEPDEFDENLMDDTDTDTNPAQKTQN